MLSLKLFYKLLNPPAGGLGEAVKMRKVAAGVLLILLGLSGNAFSDPVGDELPQEEEFLSLSSGPAVWPDYSQWKVTVASDTFNYFVSGENLPGHLSGFAMELGSVKLYDNFSNPRLLVAEVSVLGNGVVLRNLMEASPMGLFSQDMQFWVDGKWVSGKPDSFKARLVDFKKWVCKNGALEVMFTMNSLDGGPPVKLKVKEKKR